MKTIARSYHFWIGLGLATCYWIVAAILPNKILLLLTNSLVLAGSTAVGIAYSWVAIKAIRNRDATNIQHITLGIALGWSFSALWRVWSLLWLTSGQEPWMVNNDVVGFLQAGVFLGACYHLTSPGTFGINKPSGQILVMSIVIGSALGLSALLAGTQPDFSWFTHMIRPYVPE